MNYMYNDREKVILMKDQFTNIAICDWCLKLINEPESHHNSEAEESNNLLSVEENEADDTFVSQVTLGRTTALQADVLAKLVNVILVIIKYKLTVPVLSECSTVEDEVLLMESPALEEYLVQNNTVRLRL